ncbi:hypothetical protein PC114_g24810 [Phytophthora cactorum]|nr:hypothetical protein PC114_g24810 [Phytophthora cactorum]KAG3127505.1 hypothetical protein C6341_g24955 [Phytophthora cactorum]KAG3142148.1 hypothetical protein PC128_g24839 [Phytophthora cactorum]KAG4039983.1 hypothetical protein PC123_g24472 [Phytophthora cactorum]
MRDPPASRKHQYPSWIITQTDNDEDRARAWITKVKSAFLRDQAPDDEMCLVLGGLLTGLARNWYRQLSRTTTSDRKELQVQFCGLAKLRVKSGSLDVRREHIEHFIKTLDDHVLVDQLIHLRIPDVDTLEEVLRARQREKTRQGRALFGSSTYQPKASSPNSAKTSPVRKVQAVVAAPQSHSDSERGLSGSDFDGALRRIYLAAAEGDARAQTASPQDTYPATLNQVSPSRKPGYDQRPPPGRDLLQQ